jgi:formamidopyrimidine-DNA glycosylase
MGDASERCNARLEGEGAGCHALQVPELPDITVYLECLAPRILGEPLTRIRMPSVSVLRTVDPPIGLAEGREVTSLRRVGKRIAIGLAGDAASDGQELFLLIHLMIAGRLRWKRPGTKAPARRCHAVFDFPKGCLLFTEASSKKRAMLHVLQGEEALAEHDPGGLEVGDASLETFREALTRENHTLKRALTDPHLFAGIGNAYSDEILHRARLSPVKLSDRMDDGEIDTLFRATRQVLEEWTSRLREQVGDDFPDKVTAFHPEMAVHGRYREPCPECASPVQRIVRQDHETNYCPTCQTGGKLLADRALSRLLKKDWPRTLDELEVRRSTGTTPRAEARRSR